MIAVRTLTNVGVGILVGVLQIANAYAQDQPPAPASNWSRNASAGLALTGGNADTSTVNAGYEVTYDPHARNMIKSAGLFLRAQNDNELTADRLALVARDEYKIADGIFLYGQTQYFRDRFKEITYLVAPTAGIGYRVVNTVITTLDTDFGIGGVWEKNPGPDVHKHGAFTFGEKLQYKISASATLSQALTALYRLNDFSDVLYVFDVALASSISTKTQLKLELVDTFKNRPPTVTVDKNDYTLLIALVYKF